MTKPTVSELAQIQEELIRIKQALSLFAKELHTLFDELDLINKNMDSLNQTALKVSEFYRKLIKMEQEIFWKNLKDQ